MDLWQDRIRGLGADRHSEDGIARETGAACTATAWSALYGIAIAGALVFGSWQHKQPASVVAAVQINFEHSK
jgi:hypothetical protein